MKELIQTMFENLSGALVLIGLLISSFVWVPFTITMSRLSISQPSKLAHRLTLFALGIGIFAIGLFTLPTIPWSPLPSPTKVPRLKSYFSYISIEDCLPAKDRGNCRAKFHVVLNFVTPKGQEARYIDRVKTNGAIESIETSPMCRILNPNSYPKNPTLLEFDILLVNKGDSTLHVKAVSSVLMNIDKDSGKLGPHFPYFTEQAVVIIDMSKLSFRPIKATVPVLECPMQDGIKQAGNVGVVTKDCGDGILMLEAQNIPADSSLLLAWGS